MQAPTGHLPLTPTAKLALGAIYAGCAFYVAGHGLSRILYPEKAWRKHEQFLRAQGLADIERPPEWEIENRQQGWIALKLAAFFILMAFLAWWTSA